MRFRGGKVKIRPVGEFLSLSLANIFLVQFTSEPRVRAAAAAAQLLVNNANAVTTAGLNFGKEGSLSGRSITSQGTSSSSQRRERESLDEPVVAHYSVDSRKQSSLRGNRQINCISRTAAVFAISALHLRCCFCSQQLSPLYYSLCFWPTKFKTFECAIRVSKRRDVFKTDFNMMKLFARISEKLWIVKDFNETLIDSISYSADRRVTLKRVAKTRQPRTPQSRIFIILKWILFKKKKQLPALLIPARVWSKIIDKFVCDRGGRSFSRVKINFPSPFTFGK